MKVDVLSHFLSAQCKKLGETIGKHPSYFIIIPIFITLVLSTGLQRINKTNNVEYLIAPTSSRTLHERQIVNSLFRTQSYGNFSPRRITVAPHGGSVIITAKDGGSVFRDTIYNEILTLHRALINLTIDIDGRSLQYKDICAKINKECYANIVLSLGNKISDINKGDYLIKYPIKRDWKRHSYQYYGNALGGVELDSEGNVKKAMAIRLFYILEDGPAFKTRIAEKWEALFLGTLESMKFEHITFDRSASTSQERELDKLFLRIFPFLTISFGFMLLFTVLTCLSKDCVQSKPWTGVISSTSAMLSLGSAFGICIYCGVEFTSAVGCIPFVILGIGMDDTFMLLAAWRRSDSKKTVIERMGEAYSESAVAITLTSLTNFIAFISGIAAPFRAVKFFSIYAAAAIAFAYLYQLTFIGGCMAFCGHMEHKKRHPFTFMRLKRANGNSPWLHQILCEKQTCGIEIFNKLKLDIWAKIGETLTKWPVKLGAMIVLLSYLSVGFWGLTKLEYMSKLEQGAAYDSYFISFHNKLHHYFYRYRDTIQLVIKEELNYADPKVQQQVEKLMSDIEDTTFIYDSTLTESWLRYYLAFIKNESASGIIDSYNMTNTLDFIEVLRRTFLRHPLAKRFKNDIAFNSDYTAIVGSRFLFQTNITKTIGDYVMGTRLLRAITDNAPFSVFPYHYSNFYVDEADIKLKVTVQSLTIVTIAIFILCFLFMPDMSTTLCVTFSVVSIEISVMGYMALWEISLGPVSMMMLIACAGFSVDYATHFSYAYKIAKGKTPNIRMKQAISAVGMPIFQAASTTIISVLPLSYPIAYSYVTGFKLVFLVILLATVHAIVFLPIMLSTFHNVYDSCCSRSDELEVTSDKEIAMNGNLNYSFDPKETMSQII